MPRKARLDIPGLLQHVIVRGIERRKIFFDDKDRDLFLSRLSTLLEETDTDCYAWALIPNHFHLLLRPNRIELKQLMRRLLTGYAINFNYHHHRCGHVFQNRYKSIVCEEETYLLELIRYIHLNPLRAKLVSDYNGLTDYPWCGHSVIMGKKKLPGQVVDTVLAHFGKTLKSGRLKYHDFVQDGIALGKRDELVGGGLRRSLKGQAVPEIELSDDRILGSGDFVKGLRHEQALHEKLMAGMMLPELLGRVASYYELDKKGIGQRSKNEKVRSARDIYCYIAVRILGHSGTEAGKELHIKCSAVSYAVRRGELVANNQPGLVDKIISQDSTIKQRPL
ncbi:MAG: transposase [Deltaproteobacteria bacterium]|nr:transposase [Deltaproteobacteria bacterium]